MSGLGGGGGGQRSGLLQKLAAGRLPSQDPAISELLIST